MIPRRRGKPDAPVDLYDEESERSTEYGIVIMRLAGLEARMLELEYLAEFFPGEARQRELFSWPGQSPGTDARRPA